MKIFLSQIEIPWINALKEGLENPYKLHQWVWSALPKEVNAKRDFLFRSDLKGENLRILMLSEREPCSDGNLQWKTTQLSTTFLEHQAYQFQVQANPTYRRREDRRRLALFDEEKIRAWFERKFTSAGCKICSLEISAPQKVTFQKEKGSPRGTFCFVDATGTLLVKDKSLFKSAFENGIGSAKGFGQGLLMLQPLHF